MKFQMVTVMAVIAPDGEAPSMLDLTGEEQEITVTAARSDFNGESSSNPQ